MSIDEGGHIHGNFPNYYSFHPVNERVNLIPVGFFYNFWVTAGILTKKIADNSLFYIVKFNRKSFNILHVGCGMQRGRPYS